MAKKDIFDNISKAVHIKTVIPEPNVYEKLLAAVADLRSIRKCEATINFDAVAILYRVAATYELSFETNGLLPGTQQIVICKIVNLRSRQQSIIANLLIQRPSAYMINICRPVYNVTTTPVADITITF